MIELGFYTEKGIGLFAGIMSSVIAIFMLWTVPNLSEVQKYFGTNLLIIIIIFFVLLLYFDYLNDHSVNK